MAGLQLPQLRLSLDPLSFMNAPSYGGRVRSFIPDPTPEEEQSLLGHTIGALQYLGETLDKPGAAARGALVGDWGQLANLIPFSDTLGITDPNKRVSGRDVLERAGLAPKNEEGLDRWDVAGLAAEIALDPMIWISGPTRALTGAGKAAVEASRGLAKGRTVTEAANALASLSEASKAAQAAPSLASSVKAMYNLKNAPIMGLNPAQRLSEMEQGLRGVTSISAPWPLNQLPFLKDKALVLGAGQGTAAKWMQSAYRNAWYGAWSPLRPLRSIFSGELKGLLGADRQIAQDVSNSFAANLHALITDVMPQKIAKDKELAGYYNTLKQFHVNAGDDLGAPMWDDFSLYLMNQNKAFGDAAHMTKEQVKSLFNVPVDDIEKMELLNKFTDQWDEVMHAATDLTKDPMYRAYLDFGGKGSELDDNFAAHFPHFRPKDARLRKSWDAMGVIRQLQTNFGYATRRKDPLRDVPGASLTIQRMSTDASLVGTKHLSAEERLARETAMKEWLVANTEWGMANRTGDNALAVPQMPHEVPRSIDELSSADLTHEYVWKRYFKPQMDQMFGTQNGIPANAFVKALDDEGEAIRKPLTEVFADVRDKKLPEMVDYFSKIPKEAADGLLKNGLFSSSYLDSHSDYLHNLADSMSNLLTIHNIIHKTAKEGDSGLSVAELWSRIVTPKGRPALDARGLKRWAINHAAMNGVELSDVDDDIFKAFLRGDIDPVKRGPGTTMIQYGQVAGDDTTTVQKEAAQKIMDYTMSQKVPERMLKTLNAYISVDSPKERGAIAEAIHSFTSWWKAGQTAGVLLPNISFQVRNRLDGLWRNLTQAGKDTYSSLDLHDATKQFKKWARGNKDVPLAAFFQEAFDNEIMGQKTRMIGETAGSAGREAEGPVTIADLFSPVKRVMSKEGRYEGWRNPFNVRGTGTARKLAEKAGVQPGEVPQFFMAEVGDKAYALVEQLNRIPVFAALRKNGWNISQAKDFTDAVQFDYSKISPLMRKAKDLIPFGSFIGRNLPFVAENIINAPGSAYSQTIRGIEWMRKASSSYVPSFLREKSGFRWPFGEYGDEEAPFVYSLGLSVEGVNPFVFQDYGPLKGAPDLTTTGARLFSQTNPLLTGAYKLISNRDPYSGRDVGDMEGILGLTGPAATMTSMLPTRVIRDAMMWTDSRKGLGVKALDYLSGAKIGSYNLQKWKERDLRDALMQWLQQKPFVRVMETPYVPKENRGKVSAETLRELSLYGKVAQKYAKEVIKEKNRRQQKEAG